MNFGLKPGLDSRLRNGSALAQLLKVATGILFMLQFPPLAQKAMGN